MFHVSHVTVGLVKETVLIAALWRYLGLLGEPWARSPMRSPFRADKHPSFSIYDNGRRWRDFATGEGGDCFDFFAKATGLDNAAACRQLIHLKRRGLL